MSFGFGIEQHLTDYHTVVLFSFFLQIEKKLSGEIVALRTHTDNMRPELSRTQAMVERLQGSIDVRTSTPVCLRMEKPWPSMICNVRGVV